MGAAYRRGRWARVFVNDEGLWGWLCDTCREHHGRLATNDDASREFREHETGTIHQRLTSNRLAERKYVAWADKL